MKYTSDISVIHYSIKVDSWSPIYMKPNGALFPKCVKDNNNLYSNNDK